MNVSAVGLRRPAYRFSSVCGLDISGNLSPTKRGLRRNAACWSLVMGPNIFCMMYS